MLKLLVVKVAPFILGLVFVVGGCASMGPKTPAGEKAAVEGESAAEKPRVVCRRVKVTGSHIAKSRCYKVRAKDEAQRDSKDWLQKVQRRSQQTGGGDP